MKVVNEWVVLKKPTVDLSKKPDGTASPFVGTSAIVVTNSNQGVVAFENEQDYPVGQTVFFVGVPQDLILGDGSKYMAIKADDIVGVEK